jgi:branched-chain amino acid transport system permease protein
VTELLASVRRRSRVYAAGTVGGLLLLGVPWLGLPDIYTDVGFLLFTYAALAQSWNILGGYAGYLSLAHGAFAGVGGYTVAILVLHLGWSPFLTFPLAAAGAALLALIIGVICLRIRGPYFFIATMLVLFIMGSLALNLPSVTAGATGINLPFFTDDYAFEARLWYYIALSLAVLATVVAVVIENSWFGLNLFAIRDDEDVAEAMGVRVVWNKAAAFVVSAAIAGVVGCFYTYHAHYIEPSGAFSFTLSAAAALSAILGGRTWLGPIIGTVVYEGLSLLLVFTIGNSFNGAVFALLLIGVVLLLPQGLVGLVKRPERRIRGFPHGPSPAASAEGSA